ncbi:MAG TPA: hypothetical protein DC049_00855 [Spirochaetia bacterium]|nr:hypothetical protein [Spirochaetia bacterium]
MKLNGHPQLRLPNTLNVSFPGHRGHDIIAGLEDVAASTGSACHSGQSIIPPVLAAWGSRIKPRGAVHFSLGRYTTGEEIDYILQKIKNLSGVSNTGNCKNG